MKVFEIIFSILLFILIVQKLDIFIFDGGLIMIIFMFCFACAQGLTYLIQEFVEFLGKVQIW